MAFRDSFHEVIPGYRVNGEVMVFAIKGVKNGGLCDGCKTLELGNFGISHRTLIEVPDDIQPPTGYMPVASVDDIYESLELSGLSTVIDGVLVNPASVALLEYTETTLLAQSVGAGGSFTFRRDDTRSQWSREKETFLVPGPQWDSFLEAVLKRLSTVTEIVAQAANSYIALDGSNDYIEFTGKGANNAGLLDWDADWSIGINLMDFEVKADQQFLCLFKSGSNAIFLRRGGTNYGLYVTGNNGATKIGANTWYAPEAGGKLLFTYDGTTNKRLAYYIGNADGTYAQRANYLVNTANIGGNTPGTEFCIGKPAANSIYYHGGLNNLVTADEKFAGPIVDEYFAVQETYDQAGFYDDLSTWAKLGEDPFPTVVDTKADLTGGALINGTESDFVVIETPGDDPDPSVPVTGTEVAYTPDYVFVGFDYRNSRQNFSSGDAVYDDFGISQIAINSSFMDLYFKDAASMATWRSIGRSVDIETADAKDWAGTKILASSTEYSVNNSFNYIHYSMSALFGNFTLPKEVSIYVAKDGVGSSTTDLTFE